MSFKRTAIKTLGFVWKHIPEKQKKTISDIGMSFYYSQKDHSQQKIASDKNSHHDKIKHFKNNIKKKNIRMEISGNPKVSIIIPTFNKGSFLRACLEGIEKNTGYDNYEVIIVNNNTYEKDALDILRSTKHKVLDYSYRFNFSKINNFASKYAKGEYLVFLNNDTVPLEGWLTAMLHECQKKDVGIVGSKLLFPDRTIQHAGVSINLNLTGEHDFLRLPENTTQANIVRECEAVTGACIMIKKDLFKRIGGFDEDYWVESQDVDLCLKVRKKGFKVLYTPNSVLIHHELTTRGKISAVNGLHDWMVFKKRWFNDLIIKKVHSKKKKQKHLKIIVITLMSLGDVVTAIPVAEALKKKYPKCHLSIATSEQYADIFKGNPYVDELIECERYHPEKMNPWEYYNIITKELLEKNEWDKIYQLSIHEMNINKCHYWIMSHHIRELYLDMANVSVKGTRPEIYISKPDMKAAKDFLDKNCYKSKKTILLQANSGWALKDWDIDKINSIAKKLKTEYNLIQIGASKDSRIKGVPVFIDKPLKQLAAIIKQADLLIGPDSGPMHMACTLGTPVIVTFGCTSPPTGGPWGNNYISIQSDSCCDEPCHQDECAKKKNIYCSKEVKEEDVLKAVDKMMNRKEDIQETWWAGVIYPGNARNIFNGSALKRIQRKKRQIEAE